jgi:Ca-activated chloride channel homolog
MTTKAASSDTLSARALLERSSLRPGERAELHLLAEVTAVGAPVDAARPALSVVFVLDISGSMQGDPLSQVIRSVELLTDLLAPEDKVGVVAFSNGATEVCALSPLTAEARRAIKRRVGALQVQGGTNIEAGLVRARALLGPRTAHERQVMLLLTDGAPNDGASSADELSAIVAPMRADVSVSTLGYGAAHDADILHGIAQAGGGQYWFVPDPEEASVEFARAVGAQGDIVADNVEIVLSPAEACEVTGVLGQKVRFTRDGPAFSVPDLREKQSRLAVATLVVTAPREPGPLEVIEVKVRYQAAGSDGARLLSVPVRIDVADREPQLVVEAHQAAQMARAELTRIDARQAADRGSFEQAAAMLRTMIKALEQVPGYRLADGSPLSECVEQLIDEATEYEARPSAERYLAFKATQLGVDVSQGAKHAAAAVARSAKSAGIMSGATGPALPGFIVVRDRDGHEVNRAPILPEMTVGRSPGNELCVPSSSLSRRHTRFVCTKGKLVVVDLASTNGTFLNGKRLSAPTVVKAGDRVQIGDLTFEVDLKAEPG